MPGSHHGLRRPADARLSKQPADDRDGGPQYAGHPWLPGILARPCRQVLVKVGEAVGAGALVMAALLAVQDRKPAADDEPARQTAC